MNTAESSGMKKRIDDYLEGKLSVTEKLQFENDLQSDVQLAAAMSEESAKQRSVKCELVGDKGHPFTSLRTLYVAAVTVSVVTFGLCWLWMMPGKDMRKLAGGYVMENFTTLSTRAAANEDSIQLAIANYNRGQYGTVVKICEEILKRDSQHAAAKKMAGIVSLKLLDYENAIRYFNELSQLKGINDNPGKFYEAISLLQSELPAHAARAEKLLQEVIDENLYGKEEALKWIK